MRQCVGENGTVLTFEPHPKNSKYIKKTIDKNGWGNVEIVQKALANEEGSSLLIEKPDNTGASTLQNRNLDRWPQMKKGATADYQIRTTTLSSELKERSISHINFIKMDVEGAEYHIIKDIKNFISNIDKILIEVHPPKLEEDEIEELFNILHKNGSIELPFQNGEIDNVSPKQWEYSTQVLYTPNK